ncbi:MAG TPA: hypothetical protein VIJ79_13250 [Acidobacteriaceae bacterium]
MASDPNLPLLESAARKLKPFLEEIVFIGGATLGLLITDTGAAPIRGTKDVDVIAEIVTISDYLIFSQRLREADFTEDAGENPILCRWHNDGLLLDVLPIDKDVLGYTNIWYKGALNASDRFTLPLGPVIRVIAAPFFLGTKMEAYRGRGNRDFFASHDLEDFIAVIDGRDSILEEVRNSPNELRKYLADAAQELLVEDRFRDALPGYVMGEDERVPLIIDHLDEMARF